MKNMISKGVSVELILIGKEEILMEMLFGLIVLLACLVFGVRHGGIGLAVISGIGLVIYTFVFGYQPGEPPIDVMLTDDCAELVNNSAHLICTAIERHSDTVRDLLNTQIAVKLFIKIVDGKPDRMTACGAVARKILHPCF